MASIVLQVYPSVEFYEQHRDEIEESIFIGYMTEDEKSETIELFDGVLHKRNKTTEEKTLTDKRKMIKQKVRRAYVRLMGIAYDVKVDEKKSLDSPKTTSPTFLLQLENLMFHNI